MTNQGLYNVGQLVLLWQAVFQVPQRTQLLVTTGLETRGKTAKNFRKKKKTPWLISPGFLL
jgi:hypothetical protein